MQPLDGDLASTTRLGTGVELLSACKQGLAQADMPTRITIDGVQAPESQTLTAIPRHVQAPLVFLATLFLGSQGLERRAIIHWEIVVVWLS